MLAAFLKVYLESILINQIDKSIATFTEKRQYENLINELEKYVSTIEYKFNSIYLSDALIKYMKYHNYIEGLFSNILNPQCVEESEKSLIASKVEEIQVYVLKTTDVRINPFDRILITDMTVGIIEISKKHFSKELTSSQRLILYAIFDLNANVFELFEGQKQSISEIAENVNELSSTIEDIQSKINGKKRSSNLDSKWFRKQNQASINNLGSRYLPEVNVDVDIKKHLDCFNRSKEFKDLLFETYDPLIEKLCNKDYCVNIIVRQNNQLDNYEGII